MGTPYKVTSVFTQANGQPPVLVEFENGKINPDLPEPLKCKIYKDDQDPEKKYVTVDNEKTTYIGCQDTADNLFHTYLAIRNRQTHEVQLVKVESVRATAAVGRKVIEFAKKSDAVGDNSLLDLSRKFGSKTSRRVQEQKLRFKSISKSEDHLKDVVKDKVIEASDLQAAASDDGFSSLLPPRNNNAALPSEVYNLNDILTEAEMTSMKEGFEAKDSEEEEAFLKKCSPWFNSLLDKCMKNAKSLALLLYAEYLIRMCNRRKAYSFWDLCDCSEEVARKIGREFTAKNKKERAMSSTTIDKAVLRVIIINLYLADFKIKLLPLANSLRQIASSRLRLLVRVAGANCGSSSDVAILKTPLTPVNLNSVFSKKKKRL